MEKRKLVPPYDPKVEDPQFKNLVKAMATYVNQEKVTWYWALKAIRKAMAEDALKRHKTPTEAARALGVTRNLITFYTGFWKVYGRG